MKLQLYSDRTITSVNAGTRGYINHQNNDRGIDEIVYAKKDEIKNLKQQIEELNRQNARLVELLGERTRDTID